MLALIPQAQGVNSDSPHLTLSDAVVSECECVLEGGACRGLIRLQGELNRENKSPSETKKHKMPHETISTLLRPLELSPTNSEALIHDQTTVIVTQIQ